MMRTSPDRTSLATNSPSRDYPLTPEDDKRRLAEMFLLKIFKGG